MTDQECEALLEACTVLLFKDGEYLLHQVTLSYQLADV